MSVATCTDGLPIVKTYKGHLGDVKNSVKQNVDYSDVNQEAFVEECPLFGG